MRAITVVRVKNELSNIECNWGAVVGGRHGRDTKERRVGP